MTSKVSTSFVHYSWVILALCLINLFLNYGIRTGFGAILPEMIKAMAISRRQAADIVNANVFAYICIAPFAGYLADRLGARVVIPTFGVLLGLGILLMGSATDFPQAALFFAIAGIGGAAMWAPVLAVVQEWFVPSKRGMSLGIVTAGCGLGVATMGRFHPAVVSRWGWQYSWYILGAAALAMVAINALFLRSRPEDMGVKPWGDKDPGPRKVAPLHPLQGMKERYGEIFRAPRFWVIGVSYALVSGALYLTVTFMVDHAHSTLNLSYGTASLLTTVHGIGQIPGVILIPWLSDFMGRRPIIFLSNLIVAGGTTALLLSGANLAFLYLSVGVLGAVFGATFALYGACAGDYFRKDLVGSVVGIWTPFYGVGVIIAQRLGGYIRDATGSFLIPFVGAALCAVAAALLILAVKRIPRPTDR
jgi:sugar phosphate permease